MKPIYVNIHSLIALHATGEASVTVNLDNLYTSRHPMQAIDVLREQTKLRHNSFHPSNRFVAGIRFHIKSSYLRHRSPSKIRITHQSRSCHGSNSAIALLGIIINPPISAIGLNP